MVTGRWMMGRNIFFVVRLIHQLSTLTAVRTVHIKVIIVFNQFLSILQVLNDLVQGEFMQLGAKETENERFSHYFTKTYRKTASLIANSLKAVSYLLLFDTFFGNLAKINGLPALNSEDFSHCKFILHPQAAAVSGADAPLVEIAFQYGKNLGLAFQFVDDLLDFVSSSETMGKPAAADLKLGLATAPVLFACEKVQITIIYLH